MSSSLQRRLGSLTPEQAGSLDAAAAELGIGITQLMEVAGFQVARCAWRMLGRRAARVHVVAGRGHNGGDGLVASRHLAGWGCTVSAGVLSERDGLDALMQQQFLAARGAGVTVRVSSRPAAVVRGVDGADLVIDAVVGVGLREAPRDAHAEVIRALEGNVLSVDVPSGLDAATGTAAGAVVTATVTCTLTAMKRGLWSASARVHTGEIVVADIGMPGAAFARCGLTAPSSLRGGRLLTLRR